MRRCSTMSTSSPSYTTLSTGLASVAASSSSLVSVWRDIWLSVDPTTTGRSRAGATGSSCTSCLPCQWLWQLMSLSSQKWSPLASVRISTIVVVQLLISKFLNIIKRIFLFIIISSKLHVPSELRLNKNYVIFYHLWFWIIITGKFDFIQNNTHYLKYQGSYHF